ncbi:MAG: hypothetical protein R3Y29_02885 [bacterium]
MQIYIITKSKTIDVSHLILKDLSLKYSLKNSPSILKLSLLYSLSDYDLSEGDAISIRYEQSNLFYGYIFTINSNSDYITITAYDQLRYLIHRDTYTYYNKKASDVIKNICSEYGLTTGAIADTSYIIPYRIEENQLLMDIFSTALELTQNFNNQKYLLYDNFGQITLTNYNSLILDFILDCQSLASDYSFTSSTDKNVYNSIKVSVKNQKTDIISTYLAEDPLNKSNWGFLRLFKRLSNDYTPAQAKNYADNLLQSYNVLHEQLQVSFHKFIDIRPGNSLNVILKNSVSKFMLVEQVSYSISNSLVTTTIILSNF